MAQAAKQNPIYVAKRDERNRICLKGVARSKKTKVAEYYEVHEKSNGDILLKPMALIPQETLKQIDEGMKNLKKGKSFGSFNREEFEELINED